MNRRVVESATSKDVEFDEDLDDELVRSVLEDSGSSPKKLKQQ